MKHIRTILSTFALLCLAACGSDCGDSIPEADTCATPSAAGITDLVVGQATLSRTFKPFEEGDVAPIVVGPQGGYMVAIRLRVLASATTCIAQRTTVYSVSGEELLQDSAPLKLYRQDDGSYMTESHYLIFNVFPGYGAYVTVETRVGGSMVSYPIWLDNQYTGPTIVSIEPQTANIPVNGSQSFTVTFSRSATEYLEASISSLDPDIAEPEFYNLTLPQTGVEATFDVEGRNAGGPIEVGIALGDVWRSVMVTVGGGGGGGPDAGASRPDAGP